MRRRNDRCVAGPHLPHALGLRLLGGFLLLGRLLARLCLLCAPLLLLLRFGDTFLLLSFPLCSALLLALLLLPPTGQHAAPLSPLQAPVDEPHLACHGRVAHRMPKDKYAAQASGQSQQGVTQMNWHVCTVLCVRAGWTPHLQVAVEGLALHGALPDAPGLAHLLQLPDLALRQLVRLVALPAHTDGSSTRVEQLLMPDRSVVLQGQRWPPRPAA
jgi:hypothetical protein